MTFGNILKSALIAQVVLLFFINNVVESYDIHKRPIEKDKPDPIAKISDNTFNHFDSQKQYSRKKFPKLLDIDQEHQPGEISRQKRTPEDEFMEEGGVDPMMNNPGDIRNNFPFPGHSFNNILPPGHKHNHHKANHISHHGIQPEFDISHNIGAPGHPDLASPNSFDTDQESNIEEDFDSLSAKDASPKDPHHSPPQFMLDLFARFENDPFTQPASNIVRSFFNQVTQKNTQSGEPTRCNSGTCTRRHKLWFDISSIPDDEHVTMAELRLYKIVEHDRRRFIGIHRKVDVFEIKKSLTDEDLLNDQEEKVLLDSKRIIGRTSGWETFYITSAVRRWVRDKWQRIHKLEIFIETIVLDDSSADIEFEEHPMSTNEPLLIVFSDASDMQLTQRPTLNQMAPYKSKLTRIKHDRVKRSSKLGRMTGYWSELYDSQFNNNNKADINGQKIKAKNRVRRSYHNSPCHREDMYVDFAAIGYDQLQVVTPEGYPAGKCVGTCTFPFVGNNVSPYGTIKYFMHATHPTSTPKPCCVPTSLGPISLLYYEGNALVYQYRYKDMRVLECGCR